MKVPPDSRIEALKRQGFIGKIYKHKGHTMEVAFKKSDGLGVFGISYMLGDGWTQKQMEVIASKAKRIMKARVYL